MFLKVLFEGSHNSELLEDGIYKISQHSSSCTLVSDGESHVLIDTGGISFQDKLLSALQEEGLDPDDISHILLTHSHMDHTANWSLFKNARLHISNAHSEKQNGITYINSEKFPDLPLHIKPVRTKGHTDDHVVYFIEIEGLTYCCAGDAVQEYVIFDELEYKVKSQRQKDKDYLESLQMIFNKADVIIPGHKTVIEGERKKEMERILMDHGL